MKKKGFTLIEVIGVIAIIGILTAILIPAISGYVDNSKKKSTVENARILYNEVSNIVIWNDDCFESFYLEGGSKWFFESNSKGECIRMGVWSNTRPSGDNYILTVVCRADGKSHAIGTGVGDNPPDRIFNTWNDCDDKKNNHTPYIIKLCESENLTPFTQGGVSFPLKMPFNKRNDG